MNPEEPNVFDNVFTQSVWLVHHVSCYVLALNHQPHLKHLLVIQKCRLKHLSGNHPPKLVV